MYHYDIEDPATYGSDNNRLMKYETYEITFGVTQFSTSGGTTTSVSSGTTNAGFPGGGETTTLLSTPPHGDAVTFGYRPENACLEGTSALLIEYAFRRTRARLFGGFPSQEAGTLVLLRPE